MSSGVHSHSGVGPQVEEIRASGGPGVPTTTTTSDPPVRTRGGAHGRGRGRGRRLNGHPGVREIHKNAWLRRMITTGEKKEIIRKCEKFWVIFCVHDDLEALLEFYTDPKLGIAHKPVSVLSLNSCLHISTSIMGQDNEYQFVITFPSHAVHLFASSWDQMREWVDSLQDKLRDLKILGPKENLYSKMPENPSRFPVGGPTVPTSLPNSLPSLVNGRRDPNSPLPPPPQVPGSSGRRHNRPTSPLQASNGPGPATESNSLIIPIQTTSSGPSGPLAPPPPSVNYTSIVPLMANASILSEQSSSRSFNTESTPLPIECSTIRVLQQPQITSVTLVQNSQPNNSSKNIEKRSKCQPGGPPKGITERPAVLPRPEESLIPSSVASTSARVAQVISALGGNSTLVAIGTSINSNSGSSTISPCTSSSSGNSDTRPIVTVGSSKNCQNGSSTSSLGSSPPLTLTLTIRDSDESRGEAPPSLLDLSPPSKNGKNSKNQCTEALKIKGKPSKSTGPLENVYETVFVPPTPGSSSGVRVLRSNSSVTPSSGRFVQNVSITDPNPPPPRIPNRAPVNKRIHRNEVGGPSSSRSSSLNRLQERAGREEEIISVVHGKRVGVISGSYDNPAFDTIIHEPRAEVPPPLDALIGLFDSGEYKIRREQEIVDPGIVGNMPLKEQQVARLKAEMSHPGGVRIVLRKKDCMDSIAFVDYLGGVWIAGWKQKVCPILYYVLHCGDQVYQIAGVQIQSSAEAVRAIKMASSMQVEFIIRRLPFGRVYLLKRRREKDPIGIALEGNSGEVAEVVPNGLAALSGLEGKSQATEGRGTTNWYLTEINNRPLSLMAREAEVRERLQAVGKEISLLVQPADLVKHLRKQLRTLRSFKEYLVV